MHIRRRLLWGGVLGSAAYWFARYLRPKHSILVLEGKVVVITGASSGIGRALAFSFARRGARVVLVGRNTERLEAVRREIDPYSTDVLVIPADLTDQAQLEAVVSRSLEAFGHIDVLVNNAGVSLGGSLVDQSCAAIETMVRTNLTAAICLTRLVLPHMLGSHQGYIMNVGSGFGRSPGPLFAAYSASKGGVAAFTDALRRELDGSGVHLTLVLPGWTETPLIPADSRELIQRYGFALENPDDVAEQAVLGLVHGENEVILGGWLARIGVWVDRYAPFLIRLYWRFNLTGEWAAAMRRVGH